METLGRWPVLDLALWQSAVGDEAVVYEGVNAKAATSTSYEGFIQLSAATSALRVH
jgi:hypothetical protein